MTIVVKYPYGSFPASDPNRAAMQRQLARYDELLTLDREFRSILDDQPRPSRGFA